MLETLAYIQVGLNEVVSAVKITEMNIVKAMAPIRARIATVHLRREMKRSIPLLNSF